MKIWTAHSRADAAPVLVREGFSWGALLFGPLWLFARRAWIAGVLALCVQIAIGVLTHGAVRAVLLAAMAFLLGFSGRDLQRWALERRGYLHAHVIAAADEDAALARLLGQQPDLIDRVLA